MTFNLSNRTAFPLAITLCHSSNNATQHRHSLEPGQDWSTEIILPSPSIFSTLFQPSVTTVTVQFDHCGSPDPLDHHPERIRSNASALIGWCVVLVNLSAITLAACCRVTSARHIPMCPQYTKMALLFVFFMDIVFCVRAYRGQKRQPPLLGHEKSSHTARPSLFTVQIPTETLRVANSHFSSTARLDSQWALVWLNSQVMLWDTISDQAIPSSLHHR